MSLSTFRSFPSNAAGVFCFHRLSSTLTVVQIWTWKLNWNPFQNNPFCNVCGESFTWLQNCQYKNFVGFFASHALFCSYVALNLKPRQAACLLTEVSPKKSRFIVRTIITLNSCQIVPTIVREVFWFVCFVKAANYRLHCPSVITAQPAKLHWIAL